MKLIRAAGTAWLNTEFRTYQFVQENGKLAMQEIDASRQLRGVTGPRLSVAEQKQMRERKLRSWKQIEAQLRAKPSPLPVPAGRGGDL